MIDHDWSSVLVTGALVSVGACVTACMAFAFSAFLARSLSRHVQASIDAKAERVIAETPDETFIFAIRQYEGQ